MKYRFAVVSDTNKWDIKGKYNCMVSISLKLNSCASCGRGTQKHNVISITTKQYTNIKHIITKVSFPFCRDIWTKPKHSLTICVSAECKLTFFKGGGRGFKYRSWLSYASTFRHEYNNRRKHIS